MLASIDEWGSLTLEERKTLVEGVLLGNKDDLDYTASFMPEKERMYFTLELTYLLGMVAAAESDLVLNLIITRLAAVEEQLHAILPRWLKERAYDDLHGIERGLAYAAGIIVPEKREYIRGQADEAKAELLKASTLKEFQGVVERVRQIRELLSY